MHILSPEERHSLLSDSPKESISTVIAKAERKHTLKQVIDWGDEPCPHDKGFGLARKRDCNMCWAELEKEGKDA